MVNTWVPILIFFLVAVAFGVVTLLVARLIAPQKYGRVKLEPYECGIESTGDAWVQLRSGYYLYAIVFLIFDVETLFLLPFAVAFTSLPVGAFIAIMVFLLLLVEGLVWAWKKGVLDWH